MKYLPCKIEMDDYFDAVMNVVEEYDDKTTYLMFNKNTDGNRTKITNVDGPYELMAVSYTHLVACILWGILARNYNYVSRRILTLTKTLCSNS